MTKCPDCERYKLSASVWRNKAYELAGKPLPWEPDELWVGLTDEELSDTYNFHYNDYASNDIGIVDFLVIARAVIAKLKEKNNG